MKLAACAGVVSLAACAASTTLAGSSTMYVAHGGFNDGSPFGGDLGTIDGAGNYTSLGRPTDAGMTGLTGFGSRLYASTSRHSLIGMDLAGNVFAEFAFFGSGFSAANGDRINDLAVDRTGTIYAAGRIGGRDSLFTVDHLSGELTLRGALGTGDSTGFDAIAFDGAGNLYSQNTNANDLHLINPANGSSLGIVGPGVPDGALGLGWNPDDGNLYGSHCCGRSNSPEIWSVDTSDGSAGLFVDFGDGRKIQDIHFVIPAPGAMALLAVAGVCARRRRRA